jgi:DNA replication protein DnaC
MRRHEVRSTIMTSNRLIEEWGKLLGDVPAAGAILDRFLQHAQVIAMAGRSYRLKDKARAAPTELSTKQENTKPKKDN